MQVPILNFVNENVPDDARRSTQTELDFADLDINVDSNQLARA